METRLKRQYLISWFGGSTRDTLFVSHLQSQGCVWTSDCFFSAHTERKASGPWGDILWIWQKVFWIIIEDYTFNTCKFFTYSPFKLSVFISEFGKFGNSFQTDLNFGHCVMSAVLSLQHFLHAVGTAMFSYICLFLLPGCVQSLSVYWLHSAEDFTSFSQTFP